MRPYERLGLRRRTEAIPAEYLSMAGQHRRPERIIESITIDVGIFICPYCEAGWIGSAQLFSRKE